MKAVLVPLFGTPPISGPLSVTRRRTGALQPGPGVSRIDSEPRGVAGGAAQFFRRDVQALSSFGARDK